MKMKASAITAAALLALAAGGYAAQNSSAVGYTTVTVPANSDAVVSVPFSNEMEFEATVNSINGSEVGVDAVLTGGAYAGGGYYLRITSGAAEGMWSTISANGSAGVQVSNSNILADLQVGDSVAVFAHHTLGSVFAPELKDVTFKSTTQILIPNSAATGINKSAVVYAYYASGRPPSFTPGWYQGSTLSNNKVLEPETFVLVRNSGNAAALTVAVSGLVPATDVNKAIAASASANDLYLSGLPTDMMLGELNVSGLGQLLVVNNNAAGINKSPIVYTYYVGGRPPSFQPGWYQGSTYANTNVLSAGTGFILRRSAGAPASTWAVNNPIN